MEKDNNVPIKIASKVLNVSEQFIRIGLQNKRLPFGTAVKLSSKWTYHISPKLFLEYSGFNYLEESVDNERKSDRE